MKTERRMALLIKKIAKIRTYNSCGVFKGVMIRDQKKAHRLIMQSRALIEKIEREAI